MPFQQGQKVECIDAAEAPELKVGALYKIRAVAGFRDDSGNAGVVLHGLRRNRLDWWYRADRFAALPSVRPANPT